MAQCQGPRAQMVRLFTYFWQEDVAKITEVPGLRRNVNPARAIARLVCVTNYNSPPSRRFLREKMLLKKKMARGNAHGTNY